MAQVNPNDVASAAVQVLQNAIGRLDALKREANADLDQIDAQIDALQAQQAALRNQVLRSIEDSEANKQAIAAMQAEAGRLDTEAANMRVTAADLTGVANVLKAAMSLVTALAPFL